MTHIITVTSTKGGVGKTTTSVSLASALAQFEDTVLVDFDAIGQLTLHYGLPVRSGVYHWLMGDLPVSDCLYSGRPERLVILPGDSMTKAVYGRFAGSEGARGIARRLRELATSLQAAYLIIDTGAGGLLQEAAILAADHCIVPFRCEAPGIDGLFNSLKVIDELRPSQHSAPSRTVLPVGFDIRLREHKNLLLELRQHFPDDAGLAEMYAIRHRIAVAEAAAAGQTIWEYRHPGLKEVRVGYAYLAGRMFRLSGHDGTKFETLEAIAHGKD